MSDVNVFEKERNNKQAAEYIRWLASGELPEIEVVVNYLESKSKESDG